MKASTFASTLPQTACNLLIHIGYFLLKLLIILWSQVQVLVGPPLKKPLIFEVSGFFADGHCIIIGKVLNLVTPV